MKDYRRHRKAMLAKALTTGQGPFKATDGSLRHYRTADWFRDAKFGIWAHWGPQAVPMAGDWYARNMYMEGSDTYLHHLAHYGHPSEFGFKDILPLWTAENFDSEALMDKYVAAGAKYFVALGVHVDNFDCWDSTYQRWNSVAIGPKQDIVGSWAKAARKRGLKFGVTEHLSNYYYWYGPSKLADRKGPYKDLLYDGSDPDLADLYFSVPHESDPNVFKTPKMTPAAWNHEWYLRMKDLMDHYKPDLFYIDGAIPFGHVGRQLMAYYYNQNLDAKGRLQGVFNIKNIPGLGDYVEGTGTLDLERGVANGIEDEPWQIDTCIGDWFYKRDVKYKSLDQVIGFLVDTVSKNGNLLLNIPLKPDGTLDVYCNALLDQIGQWMKVNGQAIYGTRPWKVYGENISASLEATESKNEVIFTMGEKELRYTCKDHKVYAFLLSWPGSGQIRLKTLKEHAIKSCALLGPGEKVSFNSHDQGLVVRLPDKKGISPAYVLEITL